LLCEIEATAMLFMLAINQNSMQTHHQTTVMELSGTRFDKLAHYICYVPDQQPSNSEISTLPCRWFLSPVTMEIEELQP